MTYKDKGSYESSPPCTRNDQTKRRGLYGVATIVGSLNLHVSSAKEPYKRAYILQKRPIIFSPHRWTTRHDQTKRR